MWKTAVIVAACVAFATGAAAQGYPNKPVKMIVPWPAGGVADVAARTIA
jgi:tripartite-type tricarboxylate transporter receptor subunit TctC